MFKASIVIDKCPYFWWGIDGNHATCVKHENFQTEHPNCSKCDVYKKLSEAKAAE